MISLFGTTGTRLAHTFAAGLYCAFFFAARPLRAAEETYLHDTNEVLGEDIVEADIQDPHAAAQAAAHGAEHGGGGLPQFDPSTYSSQIFWLAVTFIIMYFYFSRRTLPELSSVIENRKERIQSDLDSAEDLRFQAEQAQATYESLMQNARNEATALLTEAAASVKAKGEEEVEALRKKGAKDIEALEKRLVKAKKKAMEEMSDHVAEVASEAASKIVGIKADIKQVQTVVKSLSDREAA